MADVSKAKTVTAERVIFEVAGGDHRMIVAFHFRRGIAFIKFIGPHAEYDRIDAATVDQFLRTGKWISDLSGTMTTIGRRSMKSALSGARKRAARTRIVSMCWQPWSMNMSGSGGRSTSWTRWKRLKRPWRRKGAPAPIWRP